LAWQFDWPIVADYYFKEDNEQALAKLLKELAKIKKFTAVNPKYNREVDISISKKQPKYKIVK
jgi:phage-related protein